MDVSKLLEGQRQRLGMLLLQREELDAEIAAQRERIKHTAELLSGLRSIQAATSPEPPTT